MQHNPLYSDVEIDLTRDLNINQICHVRQPQNLNEDGQPGGQWRIRPRNTKTLHGNMHQGMSNFGIWAGLQCVAMSTAAAIKLTLTPASTWLKSTLDQVLVNGNNLFVSIVGDSPHYLLVNELPKRPSVRLFGCLVELDYDPDPIYYGARSALQSVVTQFFAENNINGIIIDSRGYARFIGKRDEYFYLFDSHCCTDTGATSSNSKKKACILETTDLTELIKVLKRGIGGVQSTFTLDVIKIKIIDESIENELVNEPAPITTNVVNIQHSLLMNVDIDQPQLSDVIDVPNQHVGLNEIHRKTMPPVNIMDEPKAEEMGWFHLFPYGINGLYERRDIPITVKDYFQTRVMNSDTRFQSPDYVMYALSIFEFLRANSNINVCCKKIQKDGHEVDDLHLYIRNLRGSGAYFTQCTKELTSMMAQLGTPSFFLTFSADDLHWPDLRYALLLADGRPHVDPFSLTAEETQVLIEKFPVTVMRHFQNRFLALLNLMQNDDILFGGKVVDFWWRIEFQNRGAPHVHMVIWVENMPRLDQNMTEEELQSFIDRIDSIISCKLPDSNEDSELYELVSNCQHHHHTATCFKRGNFCPHIKLPPKQQC